jgi:hypothetical protein
VHRKYRKGGGQFLRFPAGFAVGTKVHRRKKNFPVRLSVDHFAGELVVEESKKVSKFELPENGEVLATRMADDEI